MALYFREEAAAAFRTMIVPMKLPPEPDPPDAILEYLTRQMEKHESLNRNELIGRIASDFCWLHKSSNFSEANIHRCLVQIELGDARAFYLAAQNAVLMIHRLPFESDFAELYAWAAQLPPGDVLQAVDEPLRYRVPQSAARVKFSHLMDTMAFAELLYDLGVNEQPEALPHTSKAGETVVEERGATDPMYVTEWLLRTLDGDSIPNRREQGNALLKKVRDEARYGMGKLLWRRCPVWFALKSSLHLASRVTVTADQQAEADLSYKLWVTDVLCTLYTCEPESSYYSDLVEQCGHSAMLEGARRLARRVEKLQTKYKDSFSWKNAGGDAIQERCTLVINHAIEFLKGTERVDQPVWARVQLSESDVQYGLVHELKNSLATIKHLRDVVEDRTERSPTSNVPPPPATQRFRNMDIFSTSHVGMLTNALTKAMQDEAPRNIMAALCDIKDSVMKKWKTFDGLGKVSNPDSLSECLLKLLRTNLEASIRFGKNDVRIESVHTVVISITIVLLLDRINCEIFPMLREHKLGLPVGDDRFLNALCLAQRSEKEHLFLLEQYIAKRNEPSGPVIVSSEWGIGSFQTKFAKSCSKMTRVRSEILQQCQRNQENKCAEYRRERDRYNDLVAKYNSSSCECRYNDYGYLLSQCMKCKWDREMNGITISYYERILPPAENNQWAVVYELMEPSSLSCLREAFYLIATKILDDTNTICTASSSEVYQWNEDDSLSQWNLSRKCPLSLSSTAKKWCHSHYRSQHITSHDSFVVECAKNCVISVGGKIVRNSDSWSWTVLKKCKVQLQQPRYQALQKFVGMWNHNENDVICNKSEAHRDRKVASANIPLNEFEAIGKLRAGHSLQVERFLAAMCQRSVSFREIDVVTTATALLWQVAPNATNEWCRDTWIRITHITGADNLAMDCARHSKELLKDARENWGSHNVLLVVTLFLRLVFEHILADSRCSTHALEAQQEIAEQLRFSRKIAVEWVVKINEATDCCTTEEDTQKLLSKSAAVGSIGMLTFLNHDLLMKREDLADYLHLRATTRDNLSVEALQRHSWQRQFHIYADAAAEAVLDRIHCLIRRKPACLDKFLMLHWKEASSTRFATKWQRYSDGASSDSWYHSQFISDSQRCKVEVDVLGGLFLINGKPCKRLPESIIGHAVYTRLFGQSVFSVQPDGSGGFRTKSQVQGALYTFREGTVLEIQEKREGTESILVPDAAFSSQSTIDFPKSFIEDYSHWITCGSSTLYFRPKSYTDNKFKNFSSAQANIYTDYALDIDTQTVEVQKNGWYLLDIASHVHRSLFENIFNRLCSQPYLHVFAPLSSDQVKLPSSSGSVLAEVCLPCMQNLKFNIHVLNASNDINAFNSITSSDYHCLSIAENQNYGTLCGLQQGLLLEGMHEYERKVLLMPHGKVRRISREQTTIDVNNLREPAFFKYDLRHELRDIHPPKTRHSISYLALLHATTSRLFPDPFLECTGTQRAMYLLQSGRCCGNLTTSMEENAWEILQHEAITLSDIAELSPARQFYPSHLKVMETVDWPPSLDAICAHNSFAFLAKRRIEDMSISLNLIGRRDGFETTRKSKEIILLRTEELSKRAIVASSMSLYPMDCNLDSVEFRWIFGCDEVFHNWSVGEGKTHIHFGMTVNAASSVVGHCGQNHISAQTDCGLIKGLIQPFGLQSLQGRLPRREGRQTGKATLWADVISRPTVEEQRSEECYTAFCNVWISLYNIARKRAIWESMEGQLQFSFLLSFLAQRYPEQRDIFLQLLLISKHGCLFERIGPPEYQHYRFPAADHYDESIIIRIVEQGLVTFDESRPWHHARDYTNLLRNWKCRSNAHDASCDASKSAILSNARHAWDDRRVLKHEEVGYEKISSPSNLRDQINSYLEDWKKAEELSQFIEQVTTTLHRQTSFFSSYVMKIERSVNARAIDVGGSDVTTIQEQFRLITASINELIRVEDRDLEKFRGISAGDLLGQHVSKRRSSRLFLKCNDTPPFPLSLDDVVNADHELREMAEDLLLKMEKSWKYAHSVKGDDLKSLVRALQLEECRAYLRRLLEVEREFSEGVYHRILDLIQKAEAGPCMLEAVGLWNNTNITTILLKIMMPGGVSSTLLKVGIFLRRFQWANRCLRLLDQGSQVFARLARELENEGSRGWDPSENPEWLLLEIDNDFCVRENQAEVAKNFLSKDATNQLLQLNMGEGKTDVIVPMIVAHFAAKSKRDQDTNLPELCCITVLNSLYPSNSSTWQWRIGGFLRQRIYPMLFRRDLALSTSEAGQMLAQLKYAAANGHVVVTVPEQRLSLENKVVELACTKTAMNPDIEASEAFLKVLRYLKDSCRHFLDESDMILSPLYQLVYTLGEPVDMDGGVLRWTIVAAALQSVSDLAAELQRDYPDAVDVHLQEPPRFSSVRLIEDGDGADKVWEIIRIKVLDDVMSTGNATKHLEARPKLLNEEVMKYRRMVLGINVNTHDIELCVKNNSSLTTETLQRQAEILRGLLTHDALRFALSKRWRVD